MKQDADTAIRLSTEFRSDLRFFAFFVANGSLFAGKPWDHYDFDYIPALLHQDGVFGQLFSIYVNVWKPCPVEDIPSRPLRFDPSYRAQQYLMTHIEPFIEVVPKFEDWELGLTGSGLGWKACVNEFSVTLGDGKLEPELLGGINYVPGLFDCGSVLEQVYAVFSNVIEIDEQGEVRNKAQAFYRAAQCVKEWCGVGYKVEPPFKGWEVELH